MLTNLPTAFNLSLTCTYIFHFDVWQSVASTPLSGFEICRSLLTSCPELDNPWWGLVCIFIFSPSPNLHHFPWAALLQGNVLQKQLHSKANYDLLHFNLLHYIALKCVCPLTKTSGGSLIHVWVTRPECQSQEDQNLEVGSKRASLTSSWTQFALRCIAPDCTVAQVGLSHAPLSSTQSHAPLSARVTLRCAAAATWMIINTGGEHEFEERWFNEHTHVFNHKKSRI